MDWLFVEASEFTRRIVKYGLDPDLANVQADLRRNPRAGVVEPGTCGLRKLRVSDSGRWQGKRFGVRIHYVFVPAEEAIYLMNVYRKDDQPALTPAQKKDLCSRLRAWGAQ